MFNIKNIGKKLLICGASLMMMSSLTNGTVNAKHITTNKSHVSQIMHKTHRIHKVHLTFNQVKKLNKLYFKNFQEVERNHFVHMFSVAPHAKRIYRECNQYFMQNLNKFSLNQLKYIENNLSIANLQTCNAIDNRMNQIKKEDQINRITSSSNVVNLSQQDTPIDTEIRSDLVNYINNTRIKYGLSPLKVTNAIQETANYRAPKVQFAFDNPFGYLLFPHNTPNPTDNWAHGVDTHTSGADYLEKHHYDYNTWAANTGSWFNNTTQPNNDGTVEPYLNDTPDHIAYNFNDRIMNHDMSDGNNNGHRICELSPQWKYLGVGVHYNPQEQLGTINEQFAY